MDGEAAVKHGRVGVEGLLHHVGAQSHALVPVVVHQVPGRIIDGKAVPGGGVLQIADGEDPVIDGLRQEGDGAQAGHQHHRHQAPVLQGDEHAHRQGQADPARAGVGQADGRQTGQQRHKGPEFSTPGLSGHQNAQIQRDEHDQKLREVIGVIKEGVDPPGHAVVDGHILLGGHDLHAHIALIAAVQGGHRDSGHRQRHHQPELLIPLHRADHQHHDEEGDHMEREEAHGQAGRQTGRQRAADAQEIEEHIGPEDGALQMVLGPGCAPHHKEGGHAHRAQQAVGIVPDLVGGDQHHQQEEAHQEEAGPAHGGEGTEYQASVPHALPHPVDPPDQGTGQV